MPGQIREIYVTVKPSKRKLQAGETAVQVEQDRDDSVLRFCKVGTELMACYWWWQYCIMGLCSYTVFSRSSAGMFIALLKACVFLPFSEPRERQRSCSLPGFGTGQDLSLQLRFML